jgi:phospholipid/cholesterol/gamma-HCH transport system substrate-binding protein
MQTRGFAVGVFVIGGLLLFAAGLFLIGDRRLLFAPQFELHSTFTKVTGVQVGSRVRLAGIEAGEVLEVVIPLRPSEPFRVRMRLREDLRHLVRTDSVAAVQTDGIVGSTFIQVSVGTDEAPIVEPGYAIAGRDPVEFTDLIDEGRATFQTVSAEIVDLKGDLQHALVSLAETLDAAGTLMVDVGQDVGTISAAAANVMDDVEGAIADARQLVNDVRDGQGTIGRLLTDETLYDRVATIAGEVEQIAVNLRGATDEAQLAVERFVGRDGSAQQIAQALQTTLVSINEVTSDLAEGTEALKRNFLFRGFFRDRGFYNLSTISRDAYLDGALEGRNRTAIRVWIDADVLFTIGDDGLERLSDAGRRRLDSVMADLVRYPSDSPLVVEGYADGAAGESAYLVSADRAQLVRDYVLSRFRRQATLTDIMPLSSEAPGSPSGDDRWSGVALAMFVSNDALARAQRAAN